MALPERERAMENAARTLAALIALSGPVFAEDPATHAVLDTPADLLHAGSAGCLATAQALQGAV
ncbi:hypothetical protein OE699_11315 [Sedimentimonas flavescens]|uniref:Uncharacterized protein n=1 Tax=Sedimentimonas flavescens TaxID=2851012 RepID=A0ABT3A0A1_9RHOB|nr:hypothetical protein [Sedimentimonas flavescens]MCV2879438.1 hypothetical protein [Sedimentimonas flavescens]